MKSGKSLLLLIAAVCGWVLPLGAREKIPTERLCMRDPFVTVDRQAGRYYLITSRWDQGRGGLFAYVSDDLAEWEEAGFVYNAPADYPGTDDWWAPDTYCYEGNWYTLVTVRNEKQGILRGTTILRSTDGPLGPYRPVLPAGRLNMTPEGMQCLDGSLYVDKQGTPWMIFSVEWNGPNVTDRDGEVWAQRLRRDLTDTDGQPHRLFRASEAAWVTPLPEGGYVTDAPFIWRDDESGNLILTWSSFSPRYSVGQAISRSGSVLGPWEHEAEPVFGDDGGHQMIFRDLKGRLHMSFHSPNTPTDKRRETVTIRPIEIRDGRIVPLKNE